MGEWKTPSPLNGERAGVRGEKGVRHPTCWLASEVVRVSRALHWPDAAPVPADPTRLCLERNARRAVGDSKTAGSRCFVTVDTRHVFGPCSAEVETRVGARPIRGCNGPRHSRNPGSVRPACVVGGTCSPRIAGRGECAIAFSRPKGLSRAVREQLAERSSRNGIRHHHTILKRLAALSPLTLTLSPLRGEGKTISACQDIRRTPGGFSRCAIHPFVSSLLIWFQQTAAAGIRRDNVARPANYDCRQFP